MTEEQLGLTESVSMALGGMIGGGIYAVLGVVAGIAGPATWVAFVAAGVVALCAAYSFDVLNRIDDRNRGGSVSFVQAFVGNSTLAGMMGWTLLFGYVGSMAMYAFAFGEFSVALSGVPETLSGIPLRPSISVLAVAGFVGLNLLGARATGSAENVLVAAKVIVLVLFGLGGIGFALFYAGDPVPLGGGRIASFGPIMAAAVSFVAFQGWQLLFYDQESIEDPGSTIPKAICVSILVAVSIYVIVAVATLALVPDAIESHPHTALANAAGTILSPVGLAAVGSVIISLSALFSTGSAINAKLFSTGYFAKGLLSDDLLPDRVGDSSESGVPERTLLLLGAVTAVLTTVGTLDAITSFASVAFIVVFGATSYLAVRQRDHEAVRPAIPAVAVLGMLGFLPLMFYHLYRSQPSTFYSVLAISVAVVAIEVLYFERDVIEEEVEEFESEIEDGIGSGDRFGGDDSGTVTDGGED